MLAFSRFVYVIYFSPLLLPYFTCKHLHFVDLYIFICFLVFYEHFTNTYWGEVGASRVLFYEHSAFYAYIYVFVWCVIVFV